MKGIITHNTLPTIEQRVRQFHVQNYHCNFCVLKLELYIIVGTLCDRSMRVYYNFARNIYLRFLLSISNVFTYFVIDILIKIQCKPDNLNFRNPRFLAFTSHSIPYCFIYDWLQSTGWEDGGL